MTPRHLKCRFCDWICPKVWRLKDGRLYNGQVALQNHVENNHKAEPTEIRQRINEEALVVRVN